ncbi:Conserved hypothetical protein [Herminiimonas arsenicoxydans]|uniref:Uncharacterized protein n=1 Tax=Herminiimonas arsenicoxydans TaxID=204773 RepID=A4G9Z2_HERAR|nr:Conserved hypothetical protein [Herminiimonas arsenicoxydans]
MLGYVPSPMQDELLYSVLARTALQNALGSPKHCMEAFFGSPNIIPSIDLPGGLDIYRERLGQFSPFSDCVDILNRCTLYPYFRPFLPFERHLRCMEIFRYGRGGGLKTLMGTVANGFGAASALRFCNHCIQEDFEVSGTLYWHRSHNLPAVRSCLVHGVNLSEYGDHLVSGARQALVLPPFLSGNKTSIADNAKHSVLAHLSIDLLQANLSPIDTKLRTVVYRQALLAKGLCTRNNKIKLDALAIEVRRYYEDFSSFEHQDRLLSSQKEPLRWLRDVVDRSDRAMHPICHLFLIGFLFGSIDRFKQVLEQTTKSQELQVTDVPNADKSHHLLVDHPAIKDGSKSCRLAASESGLSITTVVERRRKLGIPVSERRKHLYPDVVNAINADLKSGEKIDVIAREHAVSICSVYRILRSNSDIATERLVLKTQQLKTRKRLEWMALIDSEGRNGLNAVRARGLDLFAWLYRNDQDWLKNENLRCQVVTRRGISRIDWLSRDFLFSKSVVTVVGEMRKEKKRRRISKTMILRHLGCEVLLHKFSDKLPRLRSALELHSETAFEYNKYRIERAIDELLTTYAFPAMWKIKRHAGIRNWSEALTSYAASYRASRCCLSH